MSEEAQIPFALLKSRYKARLAVPHTTAEHRIVFEHPNVIKALVTSVAQNLKIHQLPPVSEPSGIEVLGAP